MFMVKGMSVIKKLSHIFSYIKNKVSKNARGNEKKREKRRIRKIGIEERNFSPKRKKISDPPIASPISATAPPKSIKRINVFFIVFCMGI